MLYKVNILIEQ